MASLVGEIKTTQVFSRHGMNYLRANERLLDPGQAKIINSIWRNARKGSLDASMTQTIVYRLSNKKAGKLGYGRYYGTIGGLETIEKQARGTLCADYYHDVDMVNAHPVILSQFAKSKYGKDLDELDYYIANREHILSKLAPDRDTAKEEVIQILYGAVNKHPATGALSAEVRTFSKFLCRQEEYKALWDAVQSEDNKYGTFLSFVLQTEERHCLLAMKASLEQSGWAADVLCYDGLMVRKRAGHDPTEALRAAEAAITAATGYVIALAEKPMLSYDVPPPITGEEVANGFNRQEYETMRTEFEKTHFYHIPTNQIVEVYKNELLYMTEAHAHNYLSVKWNFKRSEKLGDYEPFLKHWCKDTSRRCISIIDFKPSDDPEVFQMPLQFAHEASEAAPDPEALPIFLELVSLMARDQQRDYFLNWLAHLVQEPLVNPKVSVVITGVKGSGKDTIFDFLMEFVVGRTYSMNYDDNNQFFAPHDMGRLNKFLVKVEEADASVCRRNASTLKSRITADYCTFNPKGIKEVTAANYNRIVFTTNKGNPFEMDQGERRFLVLNASMARKGDHAFWGRVRKTLFTPAGGKAVAEFLLARDISSWVSSAIPLSDFQQAVVESEMTSEQQFLDQWDGYDPEEERPADGPALDLWLQTAKREFTAAEFYRMYRSFCITNDLPYAPNTISLGKRLLPLLRDGLLKKRKTANGANFLRG